MWAWYFEFSTQELIEYGNLVAKPRAQAFREAKSRAQTVCKGEDWAL